MKSKIEELQKRIDSLEGAISDERTREHFLELPGFWLGDAERFIGNNQTEVAAEILKLVEDQINAVEKIVLKYGRMVIIQGKG